MNHDGLVEDQDAAALIVAPDAFRSRIGGRAAVHVAKHFHRLVHPVILIDGRLTVPLDARDEEHDEDALAAGKESVAHVASTINIDRLARRATAVVPGCAA